MDCGTEEIAQKADRMGGLVGEVTDGCAVRTKPLTRQTLRVRVGRGFLFDRAFASTVRKE